MDSYGFLIYFYPSIGNHISGISNCVLEREISTFFSQLGFKLYQMEPNYFLKREDMQFPFTNCQEIHIMVLTVPG